MPHCLAPQFIIMNTPGSGKPFKGGVVGGVAPVQGDYGALNVDPQSGVGSTGGSIKALDTLASYGMTMLAAVGADPTVLTSPSATGAVIRGALAT